MSNYHTSWCRWQSGKCTCDVLEALESARVQAEEAVLVRAERDELIKQLADHWWRLFWSTIVTIAIVIDRTTDTGEYIHNWRTTAKKYSDQIYELKGQIDALKHQLAEAIDIVAVLASATRNSRSSRIRGRAHRLFGHLKRSATCAELVAARQQRIAAERDAKKQQWDALVAQRDELRRQLDEANGGFSPATDLQKRIEHLEIQLEEAKEESARFLDHAHVCLRQFDELGVHEVMLRDVIERASPFTKVDIRRGPAVDGWEKLQQDIETAINQPPSPAARYVEALERVDQFARRVAKWLWNGVHDWRGRLEPNLAYPVKLDGGEELIAALAALDAAKRERGGR